MLDEIIEGGKRALGVKSDKLIQTLFRGSSDRDLLQLLHVIAFQSGCVGRRPPMPWKNSGGFKHVFPLGSDSVLICVHPTANTKILRMVLREICIQHHISKFGISPCPQNLRIFKLGSLVRPIFEFSFEMPRLDFTLFEWLQVERSTGDIASMFSQVISAIHTMNAKGMSHGDLKLDNIMGISKPTRFDDTWGMSSLTSSVHWNIIDFGLCSTKAGDDLFFFCWWMMNRCRRILDDLRLTAIFDKALQIRESDIPSHMRSRVCCKCRDGIVHMGVPDGSGTTKWTKEYGSEKDALYATSSSMQRRDTHKQLLQSILSVLGY